MTGTRSGRGWHDPTRLPGSRMLRSGTQAIRKGPQRQGPQRPHLLHTPLAQGISEPRSAHEQTVWPQALLVRQARSGPPLARFRTASGPRQVNRPPLPTWPRKSGPRAPTPALHGVLLRRLSRARPGVWSPGLLVQGCGQLPLLRCKRYGLWSPRCLRSYAQCVPRSPGLLGVHSRCGLHTRCCWNGRIPEPWQGISRNTHSNAGPDSR